MSALLSFIKRYTGHQANQFLEEIEKEHHIRGDVLERILKDTDDLELYINERKEKNG